MRYTKFILPFFLIMAFVMPAQAKAPESFADLADYLLPTVVNISTTQKQVENEVELPEVPQFPEGSPFQDFFQDFFDRHHNAIPSLPPSSLGSGFIIDSKNGYVVTNNHVVMNADNIRVTLHDDTTLSGEIIGRDEKTDIAVIKVDPAKLHDVSELRFGDSDDLRVGDWIIAIGNPFGLGGTVTAGIVSARQRDINSGPYDDFIQTDASINRGNSGGPMFNTDGSVIGINTAIFSPTGGSVGIGFAIPSNLAKPVIDQLIKYGRTRRGWLGVRIQHVTEDIAESLGLPEAYGALVASPTSDSPAAKAGIKAGDVILEFNGKRVDQMRDLPRMVAEADIDKMAEVTVWREGKMQRIKVRIGELEEAEENGLLDELSSNDEQKPMKKSEEVMLDDQGLGLSELNDELRQRFNISEDVKGVAITTIDRGSAAVRSGLLVGDVIVEVNQEAVDKPDDVKDAIKDVKKKGRSSVLMLINSAGDVRFTALNISEDEE